MNLMELPSIHRKIISVIIVVAIISTSMFILVNLSNQNGSKNISTVGNNPSPPPTQTSPSYLSNITVKLNVSPSFYTNTTSGIAPPTTNTSFPSFTGAVVELFASPSYPNQSLNNSKPVYYQTKGSYPLTITTVNLSWNSQFKLPITINNITRTWKYTFGNSGSTTSMIMDINYFSAENSSNSTVYYYSGAVPYNPFHMVSGYTMNIVCHPYVNLLTHSSVPTVNVTGNTSTIYPGFLNSTATQNAIGTVYIPSPGGCKTIWVWRPIQVDYFHNVPIPLIYVNDSAAVPGVNISLSLTIGASLIKTGFTLSSQYFNTSTKGVIVGTSTTYGYGNTTSSSILTLAALDVNSNPTECRNGVIAFEGNMSATKYRYVEVALTGPNAGKTIETTNKYQVNIQIDSFDQKGPSLIPEVFLIGNENFTKYNASSYINLTQQNRFAVAFAALFASNSLGQTYNGQSGYAGNLLNLSPFRNNQSPLSWGEIYSGLSVTTGVNYNWGQIDEYISLGIAIIAAAIALLAIPYGDSVTTPAIAVAFLGLATAVIGLFFSAVVSIDSSTVVFSLTMTNSGPSPATVQYFMATESVRVETGQVEVPNAYFTILP